MPTHHSPSPTPPHPKKHRCPSISITARTFYFTANTIRSRQSWALRRPWTCEGHGTSSRTSTTTIVPSQPHCSFALQSHHHLSRSIIPTSIVAHEAHLLVLELLDVDRVMRRDGARGVVARDGWVLGLGVVAVGWVSWRRREGGCWGRVGVGLQIGGRWQW